MTRAIATTRRWVKETKTTLRVLMLTGAISKRRYRARLRALGIAV